MDLSVELKKSTLAKELLKLMFPDAQVDQWNIEVSDTGILYCDGDHDKVDECTYDRIDIAPKKNEVWKHKKRGTLYVKKYSGHLQLEEGTVLKDGDPLYCYVGLDDGGMVWFRTPLEFHDGRFEYVKTEEISKPEPPQNDTYLNRLLKETRKSVEGDAEYVAHNGSYQGQVISSSKLAFINQIEEAIRLDGGITPHVKSTDPKEIRKRKINAMWNTHRHFISPLSTVEQEMPKGRKDLVNLYGGLLDAAETIDNFYSFDFRKVKKLYPDEEFERMVSQIEYVVKRSPNLDLGEDIHTISENCVANILRIASNHAEETSDV